MKVIPCRQLEYKGAIINRYLKLGYKFRYSRKKKLVNNTWRTYLFFEDKEKQN